MAKIIKLYPRNIYNYKRTNSSDSGLCIFICDTNIRSKICIVPLENKASFTNYYQISNINNVAIIDNFEEIDRKQVLSELFISGQRKKITYKEYVHITCEILKKLTDKMANEYSALNNIETRNNLKYLEKLYKSLTWFDFKSKLKFKNPIKRNPIIKNFDIYYAELGENIGSELNKLRPVIIIKKCVSNDPDFSSYLVIPVSSRTTRAKYSHNIPITINGNTNYAILSDLQRISLKRLKNPLIEKSTGNYVQLSTTEIKSITYGLKIHLGL